MTRQELVRSEFGDSVDHFRQAAVHAAGGIGATVGPMSGKAKVRITSARGMVGPTAGRFSKTASSSWDSTVAAFAPIVRAARDGAARSNALEGNSMMDTRRVIEIETTDSHATRNVMALMACGAAVGAASALMARRRNRAKWAEYEPSSLESDASSMLDPNTTATTSMSGMGDSSMMKKATDKTKSAVGTVRSKIHEATADRTGLDMDMDPMRGTTSEMSDDSRSTMKRAGEKGNEGAAHFAGGKPDSNMSSDVDDMMRSSKNGRQ